MVLLIKQQFIISSTEIWTQITAERSQSANHYTTELNEKQKCS